MAIKVTVPNTKTVVTSVATGSQKVTSAKLEQLANVDTTDGLEDGYTLVYDEDTGKFKAQPLSASVQLTILDGGTF
jgi:predicted ribonuclease YlaK